MLSWHDAAANIFRKEARVTHTEIQQSTHRYNTWVSVIASTKARRLQVVQACTHPCNQHHYSSTTDQSRRRSSDPDKRTSTDERHMYDLMYMYFAIHSGIERESVWREMFPQTRPRDTCRKRRDVRQRWALHRYCILSIGCASCVCHARCHIRWRGSIATTSHCKHVRGSKCATTWCTF